MTRRAELAIGAGCGHLSKDVLVHVAHGVPVVHIQLIDAVYNARERAGILDQEHRVLHVARVSRFLRITHILYERENIVTDRVEHFLGFIVLEDMPAEGLVGNVFVGLRIVPRFSCFEDWVVNLSTKNAGSGLAVCLSVIQHFHKEQIGHLLKDGQGISDTSRPEGIPYLVDAIFDFAGYHMEYVLLNGFV